MLPGKLSLVTLRSHLFIYYCRYDWPGQRNLNLIHKQQAGSLWDIEWGNRTSFYFDREANNCRTINMPVGILTPDWLKGAEYLGQQKADNHQCNVWLKGPRNFITYYADVETNLPVHWKFGWDNATFETLTWTEGAVLEDEAWQAPEICFAEVATASTDDTDYQGFLRLSTVARS